MFSNLFFADYSETIDISFAMGDKEVTASIIGKIAVLEKDAVNQLLRGSSRTAL